MKLKKQGHEEIFAIRSRKYVCFLRSYIHIFLWESLLRYYRDYLRLYLLVECCYGFACLEVC